MTEHDFIRIAHAVHRCSQMPIGRTALEIATETLAEEIADILQKNPRFDRSKFMAACGLSRTEY
jgi:hypothetical protein